MSLVTDVWCKSVPWYILLGSLSVQFYSLLLGYMLFIIFTFSALGCWSFEPSCFYFLKRKILIFLFFLGEYKVSGVPTAFEYFMFYVDQWAGCFNWKLLLPSHEFALNERVGRSDLGFWGWNQSTGRKPPTIGHNNTCHIKSREVVMTSGENWTACVKNGNQVA